MADKPVVVNLQIPELTEVRERLAAIESWMETWEDQWPARVGRVAAAEAEARFEELRNVLKILESAPKEEVA